MPVPEANEKKPRFSWANTFRYGWAVAACVATTLIATPLLGIFDLANIVMLFLLTVVLVALRLGRGPSVAAAFISVILFDVFFVPPRFSFAVDDAQYLVTFVVMLAVALIMGHLTGRLRQDAKDALTRERRTQDLYEMTRDLSGAIHGEQIAKIVAQFISDSLSASATLLLPDDADELVAISVPHQPVSAPPPEARTAYRRGEPEVFVSGPEAFPLGLCLPLKAPMRVRGVLMVQFRESGRGLSPEHRQLLTTVASLAATVIERIHYVEVAHGSSGERRIGRE
jgi:two-component system, OmpR family, sensor histidine kinase KdpD